MPCPNCSEGVVEFGACSHCGYMKIVRIDVSADRSHCNTCTAVAEMGIDACLGCCGRG